MRRHRRIRLTARARRTSKPPFSAVVPSLLGLLTGMGFAGCGEPSHGPGLLERQHVALTRFIQDKYDARVKSCPIGVGSIHYVCTYGISMGPPPALNPSIQRGAIKNAAGNIPASYCTVLGYPPKPTGTATLCETLSFKDGKTRTSVFLLSWHSKSDAWDEGVSVGMVSETPSQIGAPQSESGGAP